MAVQASSLIVSGLVASAGVVLVEVGRRDRSPVLYLAGAGICTAAVVSLARVVFGGGEGRGFVLDEPAPGYARV